MKLDVSNVPPEVLEHTGGPSVGDVYRNQRSRFQLIVAIGGHTAYYVVFNDQGEFTGVGQVGVHHLERRDCVGRVKEMPNFEVEWFPKPVVYRPRLI
ncbi:hypothetical protein [Azospirillum sp.]|uniref:hypothetical protein n=1 Tax=Azospirillum sp. TaxID=34012 RepID=UPI003D740983